MIRFALSPDGTVVPDLSGKLPGRGAWVDASRSAVALAIKRRAFARGFKTEVTVPDDLAESIDSGLTKAALCALGLSRRTGDGVVGFEKVRAGLKASKFSVLIAASDGAPDGRKKLAGLAGVLPIISAFTSAQLSAALGRDAVHAAIKRGVSAERFLRAAYRLERYRADGEDETRESVKE